MEAKTWPVWALVCGILSFCGFGLLAGIPAWIFGNKATAIFDSGVYTDSEKSMASIGRVLGIISTCLSGCAFLFAMLWMMGILGLLFAGAAGAAGAH